MKYIFMVTICNFLAYLILNSLLVYEIQIIIMIRFYQKAYTYIKKSRFTHLLQCKTKISAYSINFKLNKNN